MFHLLDLYLGSLILRSIGIALVAGFLSWRIRNVVTRHAIGVAVLGAMLLMPVVDFLLPPSWVPARIRQIAARPPITIRVASVREAKEETVPSASASASFATRSNPVDWWGIAAALYVFVACAMFIRLATGYRELRKLRGTAIPISDSVWVEIVALQRLRWREPILLESEAVQVPMTIGFRRPAVILPADRSTWDDWKLRAVLFHEMAHVRRCDWTVAAISAMSKCAFWLNPLSWFLDRKLSQLAEQACDDAALNGIPGAAGYAEILLEFATATQNGGRLMKGGVAMANHKIQERIERLLGSPQLGTGIVRTAGWTMVMLAAAPVIYAASALQVKSKPAVTPVPTYVAEFGRNPAAQEPAAGVPQPTRTPVVVAQPQNNSTNPASDLPDLSQAKLEQLKIQKEIEDLQRKLSEVNAVQDLTAAGPIPEPRDPTKIVATMEFLQDQLKRKEEQLNTVQAAIQQQTPIGPPPAAAVNTRDALLDLPDNEDDLLAYLKQLAALRGNSFSVAFAGIRSRTVSMKVRGQDFSFGCESCSFFVGESVVSSATPPPPGPGVILQLSSDGNELSVLCRASTCSVRVEDDNARGAIRQEIISGESRSYKASKVIDIIISRN
jgi:beta-lactamase regulating signal transducer with metallopeptidase domain